MMSGSLRPTISAIVTTYNRAAVITEALKSIVDQTYQANEIIVVDDASSDNTREVIEGLCDERIKLIVIPSNVGQCVATNVAISEAKGDLIAFLDSDDLWDERKLEVLSTFWSGLPDRNNTLVFSRIRCEVDGIVTKTLPKRAPLPGERICSYLFINGGYIQTSSILLPRPLATRLGLDASTRRHTDIGLVIRAEESGVSLAMCPEALSVWRSVKNIGHGSETNGLASSLQWLSRYRKHMTLRERIAFRYTYHIGFLRRTDPLRAIALTIIAACFGILTPQRLVAWGKRRLSVWRPQHSQAVSQ